MSTVIGISDAMASQVQEALTADCSAALIAVPGMRGYFVSREDKGDSADGASRLFPLEIHGQTVYIYLRI